MASKSKRRGRVFRASCILAALIIAGSSFAWFTSKDEVTNRLTANADYGVSIVESFVPPKNWLPGQEINKDVYAVNTGNVDAFVKETITGVLNYTYEQTTDTWLEDCVQLTPDRITAIDGATTHEAGGFLAWTDAQVVTSSTTVYKVDNAEAEFASLSEPVVAYDSTATDDETKKLTFTVSYTVPGDTPVTYYAENADSDVAYAVTTSTPNTYVAASGKAVTSTVNNTTAPYPTGSVNSARINDENDPTNTVNENTTPTAEPGVKPDRWTPPATGHYIFRRSIDTKTGTNTFEEPSYTYAGYYFVKAGDDLDGAITPSDKDRYYEIVIGEDTHPVAEDNGVTDEAPPFADWVFDVNASSADLVDDEGNDIAIGQDGVFTTKPRIRYVKEYTVENADAEFIYDNGEADSDAPATLTVVYKPNYQTSVGDVERAKAAYDRAKEAYDRAKEAYDKIVADAPGYEAAAAKAETDYENALGEYNTKLSRYNQTLADYNYAKDIADATNALYNAADARAVFQAKLNAAKQAMDNAWSDADTTNNTPATTSSVVGKATAMSDTSNSGLYKDVMAMEADTSAISFNSLFGISAKGATTGVSDTTLGGRINYLYNTYGDGSSTGRFGSVKKNMNTMYDLWVDIKALLGGGTMTDNTVIAADQGIIDDLTTLKNGVSGTMTSAQVAAIRQRLDTNLSKLKTAATNYKNAYAALKAAAGEGLNQEATLTNILQNNDLSATVNATAGKAVDLYDKEFKTPEGGATGLEDLMKDYESKYDTWHTMNDEEHSNVDGTLGKANADWYAAVDAYNNALDTALGDAGTAGSYLYDVDQVQPELNGFDRLTGNQGAKKLTDQSSLIIPNYAATDTQTGKFTVTSGTASTYPDYKNYTISTGVAPEVIPATDPVTYAVPEYDSTDESNTGKERKTYSTDTFTQVNVASGKTLDTLKTEKNDAYNAVYGEGGTEANPAEGSALAKYKDAKDKRDNTGNGTTAGYMKSAKDAMDAAEGVMNSKKADWDAAVAGASPVKIIINLADDASKMGWTYDAQNIGTVNPDTGKGNEANFYLNKVLKAGETSAKLIDSVYLDKDTTPKAYKNLVFDLNVGMDSIQVTYDADQREYATDAVNSDDAFEMTAATTKGSDAVTWTND